MSPLAAFGLVLRILIRVYQLVVSPLIGPRCKYHPSCSHYALQAIRQRGPIAGTALAAWRILRCNPWSLGGIDHAPAAGFQSGTKHPARTADAPVHSG